MKPMRAKKRAVIKPCESICNTAPVVDVSVIMQMANSTNPQCETDEYALMYFKSVCTQAENAP